ncbi:MAG: sporulation transcription factor Spo0A [Ruminococcus sp.]|nr:sporulation transcription factor Spo0A [Ruminococcus sp.]
MNRKISVMICGDLSDDSINIAANLRKMDFFAYSVSSDEETVKELIMRDNPDFIVGDLTSSKADFLGLINFSKFLGAKRPKFIITSDIDNGFLMKQVMGAGASYFLIKPYDAEKLASVINSVISINSLANYEIELAVTEAIRNLTVPANIKGYNYIRTAIMMSVKIGNLTGNITTKLYPDIAEYYHTTSSSVEKAIRHAIKVSWSRVGADAVMSYFGCTPSIYKTQPTNSEYLAAVTDKVRLIIKNK